MPISDALICFSHGKESGPWGTKITRLAEIGRSRGYAVMSPDYTHTVNPDERLAQLIEAAPQGRPLVLVGSSMGGYVAAHACARLAPDALFLMAPALYFPGWESEPSGIPARCEVLHGRHDDVVPPMVAERFCAAHGARLRMLDAGHSLNERLEEVAQRFDAFLAALGGS
jgi:predicted esterase